MIIFLPGQTWTMQILEHYSRRLVLGLVALVEITILTTQMSRILALRSLRLEIILSG